MPSPRPPTPAWDRLWANAPHALISASGADVGLPGGQMGNSEVGHMSLGSGRVIYQNISRIDESIRDGSFNHNNPAFTRAIDKATAAAWCGACVRAALPRRRAQPRSSRSSPPFVWLPRGAPHRCICTPFSTGAIRPRAAQEPSLDRGRCPVRRAWLRPHS